MPSGEMVHVCYPLIDTFLDFCLRLTGGCVDASPHPLSVRNEGVHELSAAMTGRWLIAENHSCTNKVSPDGILVKWHNCNRYGQAQSSLKISALIAYWTVMALRGDLPSSSDYCLRKTVSKRPLEKAGLTSGCTTEIICIQIKKQDFEGEQMGLLRTIKRAVA